MGIYINPANQTKEAWLAEHAVEHSDVPMTCGPSQIQVCLVNNGPFTAAGVLYDEGEARAFTDPQDPRPKRYYILERASLRGVIRQEEEERVGL